MVLELGGNLTMHYPQYYWTRWRKGSPVDWDTVQVVTWLEVMLPSVRLHVPLKALVVYSGGVSSAASPVPSIVGLVTMGVPMATVVSPVGDVLAEWATLPVVLPCWEYPQ